MRTPRRTTSSPICRSLPSGLPAPALRTWSPEQVPQGMHHGVMAFLCAQICPPTPSNP